MTISILCSLSLNLFHLKISSFWCMFISREKNNLYRNQISNNSMWHWMWYYFNYFRTDKNFWKVLYIFSWPVPGVPCGFRYLVLRQCPGEDICCGQPSHRYDLRSHDGKSCINYALSVRKPFVSVNFKKLTRSAISAGIVKMVLDFRFIWGHPST